MPDSLKPLHIEVHERDRGLLPSRWGWKITSTLGGRDWGALAQGVADSGEQALRDAAAAARELAPRFSQPAGT